MEDALGERTIINLSSTANQKKLYLEGGFRSMDDFGVDNWSWANRLSDRALEVLLCWRGKIPLKYIQVIHKNSLDPIGPLEVFLNGIRPIPPWRTARQLSVAQTGAPQAPGQAESAAPRRSLHHYPQPKDDIVGTTSKYLLRHGVYHAVHCEEVDQARTHLMFKFKWLLERAKLGPPHALVQDGNRLAVYHTDRAFALLHAHQDSSNLLSRS